MEKALAMERGLGKSGNKLWLGSVHLVFLITGLLCILPLILVISISLTGEKEILTQGYSLFPGEISFDAYKTVFSNPTQLINSYALTIFTTAAGTTLGMLITTMLAYSISRKDYVLAGKTSFYVFFTMLFSGGLVPWYILVTRTLKMGDTVFALFVPYLVVSWHVLLMKGFLSDIPSSLIESAKIDGASEYRIFFRIVIPISKAGIATVTLFTVLMFWNDYYLSLMFINRGKLVSLQYLLYRIMANIDFLNSALARQSGMALGAKNIPSQSARMAMCILAAGPMLFVFPFFQKYFVKGLTVGAVKA
jgi:putative aldouronate transport system permease protein